MASNATPKDIQTQNQMQKDAEKEVKEVKEVKEDGKDPTPPTNAVQQEEFDLLKEFIPPESLPSLDLRMTAMLEDIKVMLDSRQKEFQVLGDKKRMPVIPNQYHLEFYKTNRKKLIDDLIAIDNPTRRKSYAESAIKEVKRSPFTQIRFKLYGMLRQCLIINYKAR
ncbi:hypothetical protein HDV02_003575 [Globomyces sp. JEL0801]|nr:hypothetical protein HDV02_003542 [Globomyces sp. JEL0801]KAJ3000773.1 hypothetical protein HDV02_003575 [Globomyces sp. JEL0801]